MLKDVDDETDTTGSPAQVSSSDVITLDLSDFPSRYRDVCPIGCGSKGLIFSAVDQRSLRRLAVKKLNVKQDQKRLFLRQTLREIRILHRLEHQNIIKIYHVLVSTGGISVSKPPPPVSVSKDAIPSVESLYIGMELMDTDLRNVITKTTLGPEYIKLFLYQILRGVKYMHSANVMHRDLNPSNIFINMDTLMVKIGDFGVSRLHDSEYNHTYHLSMPLTTKYYQAPELLLHPHHYTKAVDVWGLGCIFIEMFKGSPAFTGEHVVEQMELILETIPVSEKDWQSVVEAGCDDTNCCASGIDYLNQSNGGTPCKPLQTLVPHAGSIGMNLMKQMLCFDPALRIPAEDALNHPYFASYSNSFDEPSCCRPFRIEDELDEYSCVDLETMLQNESYSVTSSYSKSTDTNISQAPAIEDWNLLRVNSGMGLPTNGSYRHLLSLAETTQNDGLSESEMRTMACDFDYGVQIHGCSFSKDRMSMDFRPISSDAGCFDPYKWDHSNARNHLTAVKKESSGQLGKESKSVDPHTRGVSRSDTGYNSSYCSSSVTNRVSNALSSTLWSLSSPDVSSDHENHAGCGTPDPISPQFHTATDGDSPANSPVLQEETAGEPANPRRHNDSTSHQSSRHRHHHHSHHHHHHSHHHHHHKYKSRQNHTSSAVSGTATLHSRNGSGDSSSEHTENGSHNHENAYNSDGSSRHKRGMCKKMKACRTRENAEAKVNTDKDKPETTARKPKSVVIVTGPDGEVNKLQNRVGRCNETYEDKAESIPCELTVTTEQVQRQSEDAKPTNNEFDKKEAIHEHCSVMRSKIQESTTSAFKKYVSLRNSDSIARIRNVIDAVSSDNTPALSTDTDFPNVHNHMGATGTDRDAEQMAPIFSSEGLAEIRNMWKNDLSVPTKPKECEATRPRTWSEGCRMRSSGGRKSREMTGRLQDNNGVIPGNMLACTLMQRLRSQFSQLFSESCCLTTPDIPTPLSLGPSDGTFLGRIRHFSDDRRFVCSPQTYSAIKNAPQSPSEHEVHQQNAPPTTCSSAKNMYPGTLKIPCTRVECPF